jgi:hypothetical protein
MLRPGRRISGALLGLLLLLAALPRPVRGQAEPSLPQTVRALAALLDALQTQIDAGDAARAGALYSVLDSLWVANEDTVRTRWGPGYRPIAEAMSSLHDALSPTPPDFPRAQIALAALRGAVSGFAARVNVDVQAGGSAPPAPAASAEGSRLSDADCARYSAQAAQPYFEYARALAGDAPLPGIPPAQSVVPVYSFGPGPAPGTVPVAPYGAVYPYFPPQGPAGSLGGSGIALGAPQLMSGAVYGGLLAGGQLSPFQSAVPGVLARADLIALVGQQNQETGNRISLGALQQSVVGNQLNVSGARQNWVNTYLTFTDRARQLALSECGRIP